MPTGGGKSLCYQLPALALGQTVVVISPLIALMQDQVAQLADMGIPAALLNSSQISDEQRTVMRAADAGRVPAAVSFAGAARAAGHDWRGCSACPSLSSPSTKRTASRNGATNSARSTGSSVRCARTSRTSRSPPSPPARRSRVRHDILQQLQLREPHKYIASFHRANLRYVMHQCEKGSQPQLLLAAARALRRRERHRLRADHRAGGRDGRFPRASSGIPAVPYHGQMDTEQRAAATRSAG